MEKIPDNMPESAAPENVNVINPSGELVSLPADQAQQAVQPGGGYQLATPDQVEDYKYSTPIEKVKTVAEAAAGALTLGGSTGVETKFLDVDPAAILARERKNPGFHALGAAGGLLASNLIPGFGEYADITEAAKAANEAKNIAQGAIEAGQTTAELAKPIFDAADQASAAAQQAINPLSAQSIMSGTAARAASALGFENPFAVGATKLAIENAIFQGGDEFSHMLASDPDQTVGSALLHVGLAGMIGAPLGGAAGKLADVYENSQAGAKLSQFIEDFKGRIQEHLNNPDPVGNLTKELTELHTNINDVADEVYGPQGLKAQDIQKALPKEVSPAMQNQVEVINQNLDQTLNKMLNSKDDYPARLVNKFIGDIESFRAKVNNDSSPAEMFNGIQDLKQKMQGYSKFDKLVQPFEEHYDFVQTAKSLGHDLRVQLENPEVWGAAGERQLAINKAFTEYLPALKDFNSKFTTKIAGENTVDPGKIQTYVNQTGKAGQKVKQEMLGNFIDATEKYKNVLAKTHENLGFENPFHDSPLNAAKGSLKELTPGAQVADTLVKRGLAKLGGEGLGIAIGGGVGHLLGSGFLGALIGEHALGPFFSSILPGLVKPLIGTEASPSGLKSAVTLAMNAIKGEGALTKSAKNLFKSGAEVLPSALIPEEKQREKLSKILKTYQQNPMQMETLGSQAGSYLPNHATAMALTGAKAVQYLNSLRPSEDQKAPLDQKITPSAAQKYAYDNALTIAEQPLMILNHIKEGTLSPKDVQLVKALYPSLYQKMASTVSNEMIEAVHRGDTIPYKTRLSLSLFMGQPLDSTMTPQSIRSTQPSINQAPAQPTEAHPKHSMVALSKLSGGYQTPGQARESARSQI